MARSGFVAWGYADPSGGPPCGGGVATQLLRDVVRREDDNRRFGGRSGFGIFGHGEVEALEARWMSCEIYRRVVKVFCSERRHGPLLRVIRNTLFHFLECGWGLQPRFHLCLHNAPPAEVDWRSARRGRTPGSIVDQDWLPAPVSRRFTPLLDSCVARKTSRGFRRFLAVARSLSHSLAMSRFAETLRRKACALITPQ